MSLTKIKLLIIMIFIGACTTSAYQRFSNIKKGMDKDQVLDIMGSPLKNLNRGNKTVWIYRLYKDNKNKTMREIQFENKKVIYVGDQITFDRIINPNGTAYSQEALEKYLKDEEKAEKSKKVKKLDSHDMEKEMLKELSDEDKFVPIND